MEVNAKTRAGSAYNEDKFNYGENWFLLLDGATSLSSTLISEYRTNAIWLVEKISYFIENCIANFESTEELLKHMEAFLEEEFNNLGIDFDSQIEPTAGMILVREFEDSIEITSIGDCTAVVNFKNGDLELIQDTRLKNLDNEAADEMIRIADEENISIREARQLITEVLLENRMLKNEPDGYCVVSVFDNLFENRLTEVYEKSKVKKVYAFTDGIADYYETLKLASDYKDFIARIENKPILEVISEIREVENADMDYNLYPRFKKSDDATLGILEFNS